MNDSSGRGSSPFRTLFVDTDDTDKGKISELLVSLDLVHSHALHELLDDLMTGGPAKPLARHAGSLRSLPQTHMTGNTVAPQVREMHTSIGPLLLNGGIPALWTTLQVKIGAGASFERKIYIRSQIWCCW